MIHMYSICLCVCPRVGVSNITSLLWHDDSPHWQDRTVKWPQIVRHSDPERSPGFTIAYSKKSGIGAQENLQSSPNQIWFGDIMWHHHTRTPGLQGSPGGSCRSQWRRCDLEHAHAWGSSDGPPDCQPRGASQVPTGAFQGTDRKGLVTGHVMNGPSWPIIGCVWKLVSTPFYPMVLLIIIPFLNGYFIGNIPYFQTNPFLFLILFFLNLLEGAEPSFEFAHVSAIRKI